MICGNHLLSPTGETVAICKREPHEDSQHEAIEVHIDHNRVVVDIRWQESYKDGD